MYTLEDYLDDIEGYPEAKVEDISICSRCNEIMERHFDVRGGQLIASWYTCCHCGKMQGMVNK